MYNVKLFSHDASLSRRILFFSFLFYLRRNVWLNSKIKYLVIVGESEIIHLVAFYTQFNWATDTIH